MFRYAGSAWEDRFLPRLTSLEMKELPKENALVVLPIGAVEQHGWHLPVMTDALIGEALLTRSIALLPNDAEVWMLPPIAYGKSNEHLDFFGTFSFAPETLLAVLRDIAASVRRNGFRRLLLFNSHGGNVDLLNVAARDIRAATGMMVFYVNPHSLDAAIDVVSEREREYGIHGGDIETSMVMAIKPDWVRTPFVTSELPEVADLEFLTLEGSIRFAWIMSDISHSGIAGDAAAATPEKGETLLRRSAEQLAKAMAEICKFEIRNVRPSVRPTPSFDNRIAGGGG